MEEAQVGVMYTNPISFAQGKELVPSADVKKCTVSSLG